MRTEKPRCTECKYLRAQLAERDTTIAEMRRVLEREAMNLSGEHSWCKVCRTETLYGRLLTPSEPRPPHQHATTCALSVDAGKHAARVHAAEIRVVEQAREEGRAEDAEAVAADAFNEADEVALDEGHGSVDAASQSTRSALANARVALRDARRALKLARDARRAAVGHLDALEGK